MSSRRPSAAVYRRRRIMVVGIVLLVIAGLFWGAGKLIGDEPEPKKDPKPSATATTPTGTIEATAGPVSVTTLAGKDSCAAETIRITPFVPAEQTNGGAVKVDLTISTSSKTPCVFDPKPSELLVIISQGDTAVYDSTVCKESLLAEPVALTPTWSTLVRTTWSGRGSGRGCGKDVGYVVPGRYRLQIGALGGEPGETVFTLEQKPKPKPTPTCSTPSPKAGDEPSGEPKSGQTACDD